MHPTTEHLQKTETPPHRLLPGRGPRPTPRIVTTRSLTSHVHTLTGPPGSSGPVFVLLHGIGMSHRYYRRLQILLARHGDTHSIDLPGFGGTPTPDRQLSVADYARHIHATLEKMGVDRAVVIGHSMGTQFATELALQHPDLVSHVVLLGPVVDPGRRTVFQQSLMLGLDSLRESPLGNATVFTDYASSGLRWYLTELPVMMTYDLQAQVALVAQPALVVRGSRDPVAPRAWCEKLAATAPRGSFLEVPGKPHIVQHGGAASTAAAILSLHRHQQRPSPVYTRPGSDTRQSPGTPDPFSASIISRSINGVPVPARSEGTIQSGALVQRTDRLRAKFLKETP